jgi:hypothetical protein
VNPEPSVKRRRVRQLATVVLIGTVSAIAYHYAMGFYFEGHYPQTTFLFIPADHFNDWDNLFYFGQAFLEGVKGPFAYFPFVLVIAMLMTVVALRTGSTLAVMLFLGVLVLMLRDWVVDCEKHVLTKVQYGFILIALSYPVLFALDRMNLEILVFVSIAGFFYFLYVRESPWLAALLLGAAIALKVYPATLLLLLLAERRYKTLALTVAFTAGLTAAGAVAVVALGYGSLADIWHMNARGKTLYQQRMVLAAGGVQHGHTLWGLLALPAAIRETTIAAWQTTVYAAAVLVVFAGLAFHVVFRETERWKRVLLAVVPALLLPYVSADYTLILLYFPLVFFVNSPRVSRWDTAYVALFGVLLIPVDYYYLSSEQFVSTSVIVYPLALLALMLLAVFDPQKTTKAAEGGPGLESATVPAGVRAPAAPGAP